MVTTSELENKYVKILCEILGGSHLYGLNTPKSDVDYRFVFMHTDLAKTLGLGKTETLDEKTEESDRVGYEVRHYFNLLRKTNNQVVEVLFAPEKAFKTLDPQFKRLVIEQRHRFLDTERFHSSLRGYIQSELRLANGERKGRLGGQRKDNIDEFGFSPKNFVQLIRLTEAGKHFFNTGIFPVRIDEVNAPLAKELIDLKTNPKNYTRQQLNGVVVNFEAAMEHAYATRDTTKDYKYDTEYVDRVLLELYKPVIDHLYATEGISSEELLLSLQQASVRKDGQSSDLSTLQGSLPPSEECGSQGSD